MDEAEEGSSCPVDTTRVYNPINIAAYEKAIVWASEYEKLGTGSSHASLLISPVCKTSFNMSSTSGATVLHQPKYVNTDNIIKNLADLRGLSGLRSTTF
jgi:hypothetical protein